MAAPMATVATSPSSSVSVFDLGERTPTNLNVGARNALLRNSAATAEAEILRLRASFHHPAQTTSPPQATAAAEEGAQRANQASPHDLDLSQEHTPVALGETVNRLTQETAVIHETKIAVFKAFCAAFDETAKQFTSGHAFRFAQEFSHGFLQTWENTLHGVQTGPTIAKPSYASMASSGPPPQGSLPPFSTTLAVRNKPQQHPAFSQEQPTPVALPREDLRVFIRLDPDSSSWTRESYTIRTHVAGRLGIDLARVPQASRTKTGWSVRATDIATRNLIIQRQSEWIGDLGAMKAEASQKWYTYIVDNCPRQLLDLQGRPVDQDAAMLDEITSQTGLKPASFRVSRHDNNLLPTKTLIISFLEPTVRRWRLFGSSRIARLITKSPMPTQCENCWDYHSKYGCNRQTHCKLCGKTGHSHESCSAPEQCANCMAPHAADFPICPARPKRIHGTIQRLTKPQRDLVRQNGSRIFRQHNMETVMPAEAPSSSPAPARSSPCIQVATTLNMDDSSPPPSLPASPKKRRLETTTRNL